MNWIDIEVRKPEENGFYNVKLDTDEGVFVHSCWFEDDVWKFDSYLSSGTPLFSTSWYSSVTHWQPLPKK